MGHRLSVLCECLLLFLLAPLLVLLGWFEVPILAVLLAVAAFAAVWLYRRTPSGQGQAVFWRGPNRRKEREQFRRLLRRFALSLALMVTAVAALSPDAFFALPWHRPALWLALVLLYPLFSVYPQELLCRAYFFARYRQLFPGRWMVPGNALAFAAIHLVYGNLPAVFLSTVAGYFFADTYTRSGSLRLVWLEHALYGTAVFTVGLGHFFHHPNLSF